MDKQDCEDQKEIGPQVIQKDESVIESQEESQIGIDSTRAINPSSVNLDKYEINKTNNCYLTAYVICCSLGMLQLGYILAANNQVQTILDVQFGLKDTTTKNFYHTLISSSAVLGSSLGSGFGGKMMSYGRRKAVIILNLICAVCVIPTLFLNIYAICFGRLFHGFFAGMFQVCVPRMIEETVPLHLLGIFGPFTNVFNTAGKMLSIILGGGLPKSSDIDGTAHTQYWKFIFAVPLLLIAIQLVGFFMIFRQDTIKFSINTHNDHDAEIQIKKIYHKSNNHKEILHKLKSQSVIAHSNNIGMGQALVNKKFRKATWYCFALVIFNQLTGQNALLLYSSTIFARMNYNGKGLDPKIGTILVGVVNFVGALIAIYPVKTFNRKPLLGGGHALLCVHLTLVGVFAYLEINTGVIVMILIQIFTYQLSVGPLTWIYCAEIASDAGLGFAMLTYKAAFLFISLTTEFMMDSVLQPYGVFWMYAIISFLGAVFHMLWMKETKDLNDRDKKNLYQSLELMQLSQTTMMTTQQDKDDDDKPNQ